MPPYYQDLADNGKLVSDGWSFFNSFNSELAFGQNYKGGLPAEAALSQNAADWLHIVNWKAAEKLVASGTVEKKNGMPLISIAQAAQHGIRDRFQPVGPLFPRNFAARRSRLGEDGASVRRADRYG